MATVALPHYIEQQIARYGQGRSMDDILAEALVNHRWDDEKYEPHEQLHDPNAALADLIQTTGRTREQIIHDALIEWVSDYQAADEASEEIRAIREGRSGTISLEDWIDKNGFRR